MVCSYIQLQDTETTSGESEVKFQVSRDTLGAMLRSMAYIREQLSNAVRFLDLCVLAKYSLRNWLLSLHIPTPNNDVYLTDMFASLQIEPKQDNLTKRPRK